MSSNATSADETSASDREQRPYTTHVEPASQGGQTYHRCRDCERELITAYGGFDDIPHADDCRHSEAHR